ncbi:MAG: NAD(P)/FAD-dependent oxidoreductase, partial [Paenirhodobacter sp.]|uniref:NAD(P)/FAD-dependent oxidoreductase n=1 Tax=Paenirhodobacter sp. TaxID=1965326 RepID=UPI003D0FD395
MKNGGISFWHAELGGPPPRRAPLPGDRSADICIVGAGFTGLWAAYYLKRARPDLAITVLERDFAGFGASGRNGGWCSGEFGWSREKYLATGSRAGVIAFERAGREAVAEVVRVCAAEGIDADIHETEALTYACSPAQWARLRAEHDSARAWEVPESRIGLIGAAEARARHAVAGPMGALVRR